MLGWFSGPNATFGLGPTTVLRDRSCCSTQGRGRGCDYDRDSGHVLNRGLGLAVAVTVTVVEAVAITVLEEVTMAITDNLANSKGRRK